ncbi:MAG TPA: TRAP transporter substrate-binding protein DctP [Thermodesulfobacteriota bacterium]|nr:TRAP transporter substrate-binding protein DctP [Thermodesulfobacteriota bacterium]
MKISETLIFWVILLLGALGLGVAGGAPQADAAPANKKPEFILRCAGTMPIDHFMTKTIEFYDRIIQDKTNGRVKLEIYPVNQLFSDKDLPKALPSGAVDLGQVNTAMWVGLIPSLGIIELPFFFKDRDHYYRALDSPGVRGLIDKEFEAKGVKFLFWMDYGFMSFIGKKPIRTLEDFKGKRIRGLGEISTEIIKALGGAPAFLSVGEVYMALQRATIDGVYTSTCSVYERKFYEVTKYYTLMKYGELSVAPSMLMNLKKFKELPSDIQKILMESAVEAQTWGLNESTKGTDECLGGIKEKGMEISQLSDNERKRWAEATRGIMAGYLARTGKTGQALVEEVNKFR